MAVEADTACCVLCCLSWALSELSIRCLHAVCYTCAVCSLSARWLERFVVRCRRIHMWGQTVCVLGPGSGATTLGAPLLHVATKIPLKIERLGWTVCSCVASGWLLAAVGLRLALAAVSALVWGQAVCVVAGGWRWLAASV